MTATRTTVGTRFVNRYTVGYEEAPSKQARNLPDIISAVDAVVYYLSDYIDFQGKTLDIGITWFNNPPGVGGGAAAPGGSAYAEIIEGRDKSLGNYDAEIQIFLDSDNNLTLGTLEYFDIGKGIAPTKDNVVPLRQASFFETVLHELLHGFGLVGHPSLPTQTRNGVNYVVSPTVLELLPSGLPMSIRDNDAHYAPNLDSPRDEIIFGGIMWDGFVVPINEFGNANNNGGGPQRLLGKIDLALLKDIGYKVFWDENLPLHSGMHQKEEQQRVIDFVDQRLGIQTDSGTGTDPVISGGSGFSTDNEGNKYFLVDWKNPTLITDFNPPLDYIVISNDASELMKGTSYYAFATPEHPGDNASKKNLRKYTKSLNKIARVAKKKFDRTGSDLIYNQIDGRLYADTNGKSKGLGEGGLLATLDGKPDPFDFDIYLYSEVNLV